MPAVPDHIAQDFGLNKLFEEETVTVFAELAKPA
jgi:hypothetical protein